MLTIKKSRIYKQNDNFKSRGMYYGILVGLDGVFVILYLLI